MDLFDETPPEDAVPQVAAPAPANGGAQSYSPGQLAGQRAQAMTLELWKSGKMDLGNGTERWLAMYNALLTTCKTAEDVQRAGGLADVAYHGLLVRQRMQEARGR